MRIYTDDNGRKLFEPVYLKMSSDEKAKFRPLTLKELNDFLEKTNGCTTEVRIDDIHRHSNTVKKYMKNTSIEIDHLSAKETNMAQLKSPKPFPSNLTDIERINIINRLSFHPLPDIEELDETALRYLEKEKDILNHTS